MKQFNTRAVTKLLQAFQGPELREFENFLTFRGKHGQAKMWHLLRKKHPDFDISDEAVFKAVRPGVAYKDNMFRVYVADLYAMAKEYAAYLHFREDKYLHNNTLALAMLRKKREKTFLKVRRDAEKLYADEQLKSVQLLHYQCQMEDTNYQYMTQFNHRKSTDSLQKAADCFDKNYLAAKLRYFVSMYTRERITGEKYRYELESEILAYIKKNGFEEEPIIFGYHLLVKLFKEMSNFSLFEEFTTYFEANLSKIKELDARQMLTTATNIAYWNIQLGHLAFLELRFKLIQILVNKQLAIVNGSYPAYHFRNIIRSAILAEKFDWAEQFLNKHITQTNEKERENLATYNRAFLHFARGEYDKQAPYMIRMAAADYSFVDAHTNIFYRLLAIKTAYQQLGPKPDPKGFPLKNYKSLMNAFRLYLKRADDISENFRSSCRNFHKALSLVFQLHHGKRAVDQKALVKEIIALEPLVELPWLLGTVD